MSPDLIYLDYWLGLALVSLGRLSKLSMDIKVENEYDEMESFSDMVVSSSDKSVKMEPLLEKYDWYNDDPTVPLGWITAWEKTMNEKMFLSPNGKFFNGRIDAICYMVQQATEQSQIEEMKEGLLDDGWVQDDYLPSGWFFRKDQTEDNYIYFTDDNILLSSTKAASVFMQHSDKYGRSEIDNLWKSCSIQHAVSYTHLTLPTKRIV